MGARYPFTCLGCGYEAEVSGGLDVGGACRTVTITCSTCKELHDVALDGEPWSSDPAPPHPPCPSAETSTHGTRLWEHPGACPSCGATMQRRSTPTTLWD